jgi:50S ribosomal protein L16 3-hydroxylase
MNLAASIGSDTFLKKYWQKKPVLLKQALPGFKDPLSPEELAGLACESEVESRLVHHRRKSWELQSGPFTTRDFLRLPAKNWTLLVQAVDQWVPAVKALLSSLPFLPSWRVDDVMISYATPNGGVGPHFDYYDVFLVQGQGSRLWKTGQHCSSADELRTTSGLKLLSEFHPEQEWQLQSGDVLYVPPGVAHWGTSLDNSLCYSLGFRAPSIADMLLGFSDDVADTLSPDLRFTDPSRQHPLKSGEITADDLVRVQKLLKQALSDEQALRRWFGCQMTQPRYPELIQAPARQPRLTATTRLQLHPASRLAWQQEGKQLRIFCNGESEVRLFTSVLCTCLQALSRGAIIEAKHYLREKNCAQWIENQLALGNLITSKR